MLSRATERKTTVRETMPDNKPEPEPKVTSPERKDSLEIHQPSPAFGPGVLGMMGDNPVGDGEAGIDASPNFRVRPEAKASAVEDSAHKMLAPSVIKPTGWAPVEYVFDGQVTMDQPNITAETVKAALNQKGGRAHDQATSPNLTRSLRMVPTGSTEEASVLALLHEHLREERKRNDRLAAELDSARKAAHQAEIALARCEAKLEMKEEAIVKLEAQLVTKK